MGLGLLFGICLVVGCWLYVGCMFAAHVLQGGCRLAVVGRLPDGRLFVVCVLTAHCLFGLC